jgi:hypothetical protein
VVDVDAVITNHRERALLTRPGLVDVNALPIDGRIQVRLPADHRCSELSE